MQALAQVHLKAHLASNSLPFLGKQSAKAKSRREWQPRGRPAPQAPLLDWAKTLKNLKTWAVTRGRACVATPSSGTVLKARRGAQRISPPGDGLQLGARARRSRRQAQNRVVL